MNFDTTGRYIFLFINNINQLKCKKNVSTVMTKPSILTMEWFWFIISKQSGLLLHSHGCLDKLYALKYPKPSQKTTWGKCFLLDEIQFQVEKSKNEHYQCSNTH